MRTISIETAADIAIRLAADAVAKTVAEGEDAGFDARFHRSLFLGACADVEARESKARAIKAAVAPAASAAPTAPPAPPIPSADAALLASAVAAAVAEERARAVNEVADRRARAGAAAEAETNRLVAEIAGFAPGRALAPTADAAPTTETDEAAKLAAEIAAFVPSRDQAEGEPEAADDLAAQIAAFAPARGEPVAGAE